MRKSFFGPTKMKFYSVSRWEYTDIKNLVIGDIFDRTDPTYKYYNFWPSYTVYCYAAQPHRLGDFKTFEDAKKAMADTLTSLGYIWKEDHYKVLL